MHSGEENLTEADSADTYGHTQVGSNRQDGFDASTAGDVLRIGGAHRQDHGAQGCLAWWNRIRDSDDSVLHQSWRKELECYPTRGARERETDFAAPSRPPETNGGKEAIDTGGR